MPCHHWVTKKSVDDDRHVVWSFLSHEMIFVPVHKNNDHWVLFIIWPASRDITVIDSLYDTRQWHVIIFLNLVKFIQDYHNSKELPEDQWADK
jgi:Ulp1 family protease